MDALEELDVWKRSKKLVVDIYKLTTTCKDPNFKTRSPALLSQLLLI